MKRILIVAAIVTGIAAAPAVLAADAGSGQRADDPYANAHAVEPSTPSVLLPGAFAPPKIA